MIANLTTVLQLSVYPPYQATQENRKKTDAYTLHHTDSGHLQNHFRPPPPFPPILPTSKPRRRTELAKRWYSEQDTSVILGHRDHYQTPQLVVDVSTELHYTPPNPSQHSRTHRTYLNLVKTQLERP